jgi:hypothetical protein
MLYAGGQTAESRTLKLVLRLRSILSLAMVISRTWRLQVVSQVSSRPAQ